MLGKKETAREKYDRALEALTEASNELRKETLQDRRAHVQGKYVGKCYSMYSGCEMIKVHRLIEDDTTVFITKVHSYTGKYTSFGIAYHHYDIEKEFAMRGIDDKEEVSESTFQLFFNEVKQMMEP